MSDDFQGTAPDGQGVVDTHSTPLPAPSTSDVVSNAIEIANSRAADREAGKPVSVELPSAVPDRARDERGKFTRPNAPSKEHAPKAEPAQTPAPAAASPEAMQPNPRWSDAKKADFARLSPDAQKLVLDHAREADADYTRKTQEIAEQRKHVEPILQALGPHTQYLNELSQAMRQPTGQMIGSLIGTERTLRTGTPEVRAQTLAMLIREYPVPLELLNRALGQAPQAQGAPPIPPELRQQLAELQQFRQQTEAERQQQRQENESREVAAQIESFKSAKDANGQLKYPHFEAVRAQMAKYVPQNLSFHQAYMLAVEDMGAALSPQPSAAASATSDKDRAATIARARQASSPKTHGTQPGGSVAARSTSEAVANSMRAAGYAI